MYIGINKERRLTMESLNEVYDDLEMVSLDLKHISDACIVVGNDTLASSLKYASKIIVDCIKSIQEYDSKITDDRLKDAQNTTAGLLKLALNVDMIPRG